MAIPPQLLKIVFSYLSTYAFRALQRNPGYQRFMARANRYVEQQLEPQNLERNLNRAKAVSQRHFSNWKRTWRTLGNNYLTKK